MPRLRVRGADITDEAFVKCRNYRHAWDEFYPDDMENPWYGWRLSLRCIRCTTERHDNYDFKNELMGRKYRYPEGYQTKGEDRPTMVEFRQELFDRLRAQLETHHGLGQDAEIIPIKAVRKAPAKKTTAKKTTAAKKTAASNGARKKVAATK